jgi:hypothetical protein
VHVEAGDDPYDDPEIEAQWFKERRKELLD